MIGLDITRRTMPPPGWCSRLEAHGSPAAQAVAGMWRDPTSCLHDACVIAWLLRPSLFTLAPRHVAIELSDEAQLGRTYAVPSRPPNAEVAVNIDADGFFDLLTGRLLRL